MNDIFYNIFVQIKFLLDIVKKYREITMKKFTCIALGVAMGFTNLTSSVHAGFQSHTICGFSLEHETTGTTGSNTTGTTAPNTNSSDFPTGDVDPTTIIGQVGECPDPGYGGGSVAGALFGGIFLGFIIGVGATLGVTYGILRQKFPEIFDLNTLNETQFGDYGKFEMEPTYYPESDSAGLRFRFVF